MNWIDWNRGSEAIRASSASFCEMKLATVAVGATQMAGPPPSGTLASALSSIARACTSNGAMLMKRSRPSGATSASKVTTVVPRPRS